MNAPVLRFPEFKGEWTTIKLGAIATFSKGKGLSKADIAKDGKTPCIRYGELYTTYGARIEKPVSYTNIDKSNLVLSKGGEVLIPASGETSVDIATASVVEKREIAIGGDLNIIRSPLNGFFLASYLSGKYKKQLARLSQGNSVVHLYKEHITSLKLSVPDEINEQQKIADFLTAVDKKITQLTQKKALLEDYKKGCMQQLFSQQIRFKDDEGNDYPDWEEKKIGNLMRIQRGASPRPISSPKWFSNDSEIGWVRISDVSASNKVLKITSQKLSDNGVKKSRLVSSGKIIMSICATIGKPIFTGFNVCIHDGFVVFDDLKIDEEYLYYFLVKIQKKWYRYGQPGTQTNLNTNIVSKEIINYPTSQEEQQKIANFLSALDKKIDSVQQQIEHTQQFKKGLLHQMFV